MKKRVLLWAEWDDDPPGYVTLPESYSHEEAYKLPFPLRYHRIYPGRNTVDVIVPKTVARHFKKGEFR